MSTGSNATDPLFKVQKKMKIIDGRKPAIF